MERTTKQKEKQEVFHKRVDFNIILSAIFLSVFGLMMMYSSCLDTNELKSQFKFMVIGFVIMMVCQFLNYEWLRNFATAGLLGVFGLIVLLKVPGIGVEEQGVTRWIQIAGIKIQVSEPIKILMIVFFAYYIVKHLIEINTVKGVLKIWCLAGVVGFLLLKISSNLSACLILLMITFCITFISSNKKKLHVMVFLAAILGVISIYCFFKINSPSVDQLKEIKDKSYQVARIIAWTNPEKYVEVNGHQTVQGLYAIGSGGLFGKGLGKGVQKYEIPEPHQDMIFCTIVEELGIVGAIVLMMLYAYLMFHIMMVATGTKDIFGQLICAGIMFNIAFQVLVNIGVATAFLPNTGVTLPFVSSGGSAIVMVFAQLAIVLSVYRQNKKHVDERMDRRMEKRMGQNLEKNS